MCMHARTSECLQSVSTVLSLWPFNNLFERKTSIKFAPFIRRYNANHAGMHLRHATTVENTRPHADHFGSGTLVSRTVQDSRSEDASILSAFWSPPALTPWFRTYNGGAGGSLIGNTNPLNLQKHYQLSIHGSPHAQASSRSHRSLFSVYVGGTVPFGAIDSGRDGPYISPMHAIL